MEIGTLLGLEAGTLQGAEIYSTYSKYLGRTGTDMPVGTKASP